MDDLARPEDAPGDWVSERDLARILTAFAETILHVRTGNPALLTQTLGSVSATMLEVAGDAAEDPAARVLREVGYNLATAAEAVGAGRERG
jgi:hypothetical protein